VAVSNGNLIVAEGVPTHDGLGAVGGREHSSDEYMELESYFERTAWLAVALRQLADAPAPRTATLSKGSRHLEVTAIPSGRVRCA
jgi:hypothetical protein